MFRGFKKDKAFRKPKWPEMFVPPKNELGDLTDDELDKLTRDLKGDKERAKRILNLKRQYEAGTIPELITFDWLMRNHIRFIYQATFAGGRARRGGLVPDFVLERGQGSMVWNVDGVYYHDTLYRGRGFKDIRNDIRLKGQMINGRKVEKIIHITDTAILSKYPEVFIYALSGIQLEG